MNAAETAIAEVALKESKTSVRPVPSLGFVFDYAEPITPAVPLEKITLQDIREACGRLYEERALSE